MKESHFLTIYDALSLVGKLVVKIHLLFSLLESNLFLTIILKLLSSLNITGRLSSRGHFDQMTLTAGGQTNLILPYRLEMYLLYF